MENVAKLTLNRAVRTYCTLTKPGIILGNAFTATGGFAIASRNSFDYGLFLTMLIGLSLVIASACVFNNYMDRTHDVKMARTKNRALASGLISPQRALLFATLLGVLGTLSLALFTNLLTTGIALFGFSVYIFLYSFLKYRTVHGTLIGSIAGAAPPLIGYCAAAHQIDIGAFLLFIWVALWQMPHFFAIAIYRLEEYAAAAIPILPIKRGIHTTKIQMLFYILAFIAVSFTLTEVNSMGFLYLSAATLSGIAWLLLCIQGFTCTNNKLWARKMFLSSLVVITTQCISIPFSI